MRALSFLTIAIAFCSTALSASGQTAPHLDPEVALKTCAGTISDECVIRHFKDSQEASIIRGHLVFQNYCILCHGTEGKGDGRAAKLHTPRPFNLTTSTAPRYYIEQILRKGGEQMGRGKGMPPWGDQLTDEQVSDTLNFLFSIRNAK